MPILWILVLLLWLPARAELSQQIKRACQRDPHFYQACIRNLEDHYTPGYRAYDLFAYLEKPGPLTLKSEAGPQLETSQELDLALEGPGFFVLSHGRLVRSAACRIRQGHLCTSQGDQLLSTPEMQPLSVPQDTSIRVTRAGEVEYLREGQYQSAGRLATACVARPGWLHAQGPVLTPTAASGPPQLQPVSVLSRRLELGNASPLEQQETSQGILELAGIKGSGNSTQARRDLLRIIAQHDRRCAASLENLKRSGEPGYRANDVLTPRLRGGPGPLQETRDPYNLAIDGEGYLALSNGLITRNGSLHFGRSGQLLTSEGYALRTLGGQLQLPADMGQMEIHGDGRVMGTRLNGDGKAEEIDRIIVVRVSDPTCLKREGAHLRPTAQSGPIRSGIPGKDGLGTVVQGYLEYGNLNPIEQIKMLHAMRNYARLLGMPLADDYQP